MVRVKIQSWMLMAMAILAAGLLAPDILWAAAESKYGIDPATGKDIVDSARSIWGVVSVVAAFAGLIGLVVMIFVNKLWGFIVLVIAGIAGFGEKIVTFIIKKGGGAGEDLLNKTTSIAPPDTGVITVVQVSDLSQAVHSLLTLLS